MNRIKSFEINHKLLVPGFYLSRVDGDVETFDIRIFQPNNGDYMTTGGAHALEHILATLLRNKCPGNVIYVGPMGCRTGFYCLFRGLSHEKIFFLLKDAFNTVVYWNESIPGASAEECGNYLDMDLLDARQYGYLAWNLFNKSFKEEDLKYPEEKDGGIS